MMKPKGKYRAGCNYSCHEFHPKQVRENRQKNKKNEKKEGKEKAMIKTSIVQHF